MLNAPSNPHVRPAPYLLRTAPRGAVRTWAETAWSLYPPAAIVVAALLLAGSGCQSDDAGDPAAPSARLARQDLPITEPGDAERRQAMQAEGGAISTNPGEATSGPVYASYPSELPLIGTAAARATIRYGADRLELANLSRLPWTESRLWVNRTYSVLLPHTKPGDIRSIHFSFLRDAEGRPFPTDNRNVRIEEVEIVSGDERTKVRFGLAY